MKPKNGKRNIRLPKRLKYTPNFLSFARRLESLGASAIRPLATLHQRKINRDLEQKRYRETSEVRKIRSLCQFIETSEVPIGLSTQESGFYRRIAEKLVARGIWLSKVLNQFDE